MINKLYSLLTANVQQDRWTDYYDKARSSVSLGGQAARLVKELMASAESAGDTPEQTATKMKKLACVICRESLLTCFGREISALDPDNTYRDVGRQHDATDADDAECFYALAQPQNDMRRLERYLDEDIAGRLAAPTWFEWMAAGALQLLREAK